MSAGISCTEDTVTQYFYQPLVLTFFPFPVSDVPWVVRGYGMSVTDVPFRTKQSIIIDTAPSGKCEAGKLY